MPREKVHLTRLKEKSVIPKLEWEYDLLHCLPKITIMTLVKSFRNTFRGMICALQPMYDRIDIG